MEAPEFEGTAFESASNAPSCGNGVYAMVPRDDEDE